MKKRLHLTVGDMLLMGFLLILAMGLFCLPFLKAPAQTAEILIAETGKTHILSLSQEATYEIRSRDIALTICVTGGEIYVAASDCQDGICRHTPPISRAGQSIVCAPAGVVIRVIGEGATVDGVSG